MNRTEVKEIEKTLHINHCSIQKMVGAYVNEEKEIVCYINQTFLAMPEELIFKYLAIAKKLFNKNVEDNVLSAPFAGNSNTEHVQNLFQTLLNSHLKNVDALSELYDRIIEEYDYVGNYLILLWYDVYDVPGKGSDGADQDESEEVYEHLMCAICRVDLTAAGLSYNPRSNEFMVRQRDWVVDLPDCGFVYPSFEDRTAQYDRMMFYASKPANVPHNFMEQCLQLQPVRSITEIRRDFGLVLKRALGSVHDAEYWLPYIGQQIYMEYGDDEETCLFPEELEAFCNKTGMGEVCAQKIRTEYASEFSPKYPKVSYFLNKSMIKEVEALMEKQEIQNTFRKAAKALKEAAGESDLTEQLYALANGK